MDAKIALLPGDGIGPDIVAETRKVLDAVAAKYGHNFNYSTHLVGGIAIDEMGTALPEETLGACLNSDAVLLGAVGGPKWDDPRAKVRPEQGILGLRKGLNTFANVRPVKVFDALAEASPLKTERVKGVDIVILRELTGGIYFGQQGRDVGDNGRYGYNQMIYNEHEIRRIVEIAFSMARKRRKKVTSVDKANVLATSRVWREVAQEVADENPDIEYEVVLVDAMAMYLVNHPSAYDVVVTGNMFGDILSDEASMITGSLGMLPSASLGMPGTPGVFEPIHGSAPDIAGKGIANPLATILSAAMMIRSGMDMDEEATVIETAVSDVLAAGHRTADIAKPDEETVSTSAMGDLVIEALG
ncbi:MAG: 3-isopropylmalate dehydrogenase [Chloroflexota bacterium]